MKYIIFVNAIYCEADIELAACNARSKNAPIHSCALNLRLHAISLHHANPAIGQKGHALQDTVVWAQPPVFTVDLVFREGEGRLGFRPRLEDVEAAALGGLDLAVNSATGIPKAGSTDGPGLAV